MCSDLQPLQPTLVLAFDVTCPVVSVYALQVPAGPLLWSRGGWGGVLRRAQKYRRGALCRTCWWDTVDASLGLQWVWDGAANSQTSTRSAPETHAPAPSHAREANVRINQWGVLNNSDGKLDKL